MRPFLALVALLPLHAAEHVIVYREPGRFGGWPANSGIYSWGNEILVGFSRAWHKAQDPGRHQMDRDKPAEGAFARSLDGGRTWTIEPHPEVLSPEQPAPKTTGCPGGIDFTHPGFAMTLRMAGIHTGPSRFHYSTNRGKSWTGPCALPMFDRAGVAARTDYIVNGKRDCLIFLTASKDNQREGRVMCARTTDGGKTWNFVSWIGPEPKGFDIMPSSIRLSPSRILTTVRHNEGRQNWIDSYLSENDAKTWTYFGRPVPDTGAFNGNPPSLIKLKDGRLCLTYGYRSEPYQIRARLSSDSGKTWTDDIVLRDNGAAWDLGYTRTVQRPDGKIVTIYYFNDGKQTERFIEATIWDPPPLN